MLAKAALSVVCLGLIKTLDTTDPDVLFYIRVAFASAAVAALSVYGILYLLITQNNTKETVSVFEADLVPSNPLAFLQGDKPTGKAMSMSVSDYDMHKLKMDAKQTVTTLVIISVLHLWFGFVPPLILQSVMIMFNVLYSELSRLYLFRQSPVTNKELKRPFRGQGGVMSTFKDLKKQVNEQMAGEDVSKRKNKKEANRRRITKTK